MRIAAYNAQDTIAETLASVLNQTLLPDEIIVVDDRSTDHTAKVASASGCARIASGFPLHVILHAHLTGARQSRIVRSARSDAFRALAPSSLFLLRAQGKQVAANCALLVGRLGTYAFEIGTDIEAAVAELIGFMHGLKQ